MNLESDMEEISQYMRRKSLRIDGVPIGGDESSDTITKLVKNCFDEAGIFLFFFYIIMK